MPLFLEQTSINTEQRRISQKCENVDHQSLLELNHQQEQQRLIAPSLHNQPAWQALKKQ